MAKGIKERFRSSAWLYPIGWFNTQCARPFTWFFLVMGLSPNQVTLLSAGASAAGVIVAWKGSFLAGALLIHIGLLWDHSDGQVARAQGSGSTWGMYLDWTLDRIVEVAVVALLGVMALDGTGIWHLPAPAALALTVAAIGAALTWRSLNAYNDLLFLREHLIQKQAMPKRGATMVGPKRRPLIPFPATRDWLFLFVVVGIGWPLPALALAVIAATFGASSLEKAVVFLMRHKQPEGDAARVLWSDFH